MALLDIWTLNISNQVSLQKRVMPQELLTGEKTISFTRTQENRSLATNFIHSMENNLFDIIDARVMKDAKQKEVIAVEE